MTALPRRRRRRTVLALVLSVLLTTVAGAGTAVGVLTLRDSQEGRSVPTDARSVVMFPATPNLGLAVVDDQGRLASLVVVTLLPDGAGGSIVTVPVNADAAVGLGPAPQPVNSVFSAADPAGFDEVVESLLSVTIERFEVVDAAALAAIVDPLTPVEVDLPEDVVDSDTVGSGIVIEAGPQTLRASVLADALAAIDTSGSVYDHHAAKVDLWSAVAAGAPIDAAAAPAGGDGSVAAPATTEEFFDRLWSGPVQVRDLDIDPGLAALAENPAGIDMVVLDRRDSLLVFAQVSPSLVSTPNDGLTFRLELRLSDDQLAAGGEQWANRSQAARTLVGELLFFSANLVSVDPTPIPGGAPAVTRIEVAQERFMKDLIEFAPLVFGESEVVLAPVELDGVDVVVKLGTGFLDVQRRQTDATVGDG